MTNTILRLSDVIARTKISRSTIYAKISEGTFPKQILLGARAVGWVESEISEWIDKQIQESRKGDEV